MEESNIPNQVQIEVDEADPTSDLEENVATETGEVVGNFFNELRMREQVQKLDCAAQLHTVGESSTVDQAHGSTDHDVAQMVGRRLAIIADEINERYSSDFSRMIRQLKLTPSTAREELNAIARQLFNDGAISWSRIVVLFLFGYRFMLSVLRAGMGEVAGKFVSFLVEFIIREKIARWVASQGGWRTVLRMIPESVSWSVAGFVISLATISFLAAIFLRRIC